MLMNVAQPSHTPRSRRGTPPASDWLENRNAAVRNDPDALLKELVSRRGLPPTEARLLVLRILRDDTDGHMSAEQLCRALVKQDFATGVSTFKSAIYDLNLAGVLSRVIAPLNSNRAQALYEIADKPWHRHLYCTGCERLIEICDEVIEQRISHQFAVAGLTQANLDFARAGKCLACANAESVHG
ncbi:Fur family transcriptional regulator [Cupriavidus taiwanensis]|uniref:Ferric uptake regulation protein n=1 Tax=Cupriavidus taiwanensis TaxID=164546 RepID=A0A7Z7NRJ0_9BURK|nr:transcriptional repressor [Cupriavidus taiwanensis]SOZ17483.1 hypothetical protein CBM2597_U10255 [Cupriavidus taiwanensis]SOZ96275.1 hypothetical protein CBM2598_U10096 [Cupriavidus taiwanensis]SPC25760.1 hypothetical protein CBM2594_U10261 [Cupriavidus taiwanensis]